jgi:hypothetical protein
MHTDAGWWVLRALPGHSLKLRLGHLICSQNTTTSLDRNPLEESEAVSNLGVRCRVDLSALCIAKEVVQRVIALPIVVVRALPKIIAIVDRIVDRAVRVGLLRGIIAIGGMGMRISITSRWARMHLARVIVIARSSSCKVLQVSNHYFPLPLDEGIQGGYSIVWTHLCRGPVGIRGAGHQAAAGGSGEGGQNHRRGSSPLIRKESLRGWGRELDTLTCFFRS